MSRLYQDPTSISSCNKLTISLWINFPQASIDSIGYVIGGEFGYRPSYSDTPDTIATGDLQSSYITVSTTGLDVVLCSESYNLTSWHDLGPGFPTDPARFTSSINEAQNRAYGRVDFAMAVDKWHHVLVAWDSSEESRYDAGKYLSNDLHSFDNTNAWAIPTAWNTMKIAIDGVVRTESKLAEDNGDSLYYSDAFLGSNSISGITVAPQTAHMPFPFVRENNFLNFDLGPTFLATGGRGFLTPTAPSSVNCLWRDTRPAANPGFTTFFTRTNTFLPWNVKVSGRELAFPAAFYDVSFLAVSRFADVQMWFGQYIDPSTNLGMFVSPLGKPVNPSIPAGAFGPQDVLFRRKASLGWEFRTNRGSGGPFTQVGSVADFSPWPGQ